MRAVDIDEKEMQNSISLAENEDDLNETKESISRREVAFAKCTYGGDDWPRRPVTSTARAATTLSSERFHQSFSAADVHHLQSTGGQPNEVGNTCH